jgi:hypothetical protein
MMGCQSWCEPLPDEASIFLKKILDTHRYILRKSVNFGPFVQGRITGHLPWKMGMTLSGFGLARTTNTNG